MPWSRCGLAALLLIAGLTARTDLSLTARAQQPPPPVPKPAVSAPRPQTAETPGQSPAPTPPPAPVPPPPPPPRFVIVIDAAHGGDDLGGHLSSGQLEKNANLTLSVRLRSALGARGIQVITTRESDQSVAMDRRAEIANHADAKACISLHTADTGSGAHLFVSSLAPATTARFVAWKTAQAAWVTRSLALAGVLNSALLQAGATVTLGRTPLPGIESMTCPAVTIEVAPERDADHKVTAEPDDAAYQSRLAQTLATALLEWRTDAFRPDASRPEGRQP
jgi:N-acetylmuramoyl-L-alanine amidase